MKNQIFILLSVLALLFSPNFSVSDCTDFGRVINWDVQDEKTIVYYSHNRPAAKIVLEDCTVNPSSTIHLTKSYMCDEDSLTIDGQKCAIMSLMSALSGPF